MEDVFENIPDIHPYKEFIGKRILDVIQYQAYDDDGEFDDDGYLKFKFTDGSEVTLMSYYEGYTGASIDEYPTSIKILDPDEDLFYKIKPLTNGPI